MIVNCTTETFTKKRLESRPTAAKTFLYTLGHLTRIKVQDCNLRWHCEISLRSLDLSSDIISCIRWRITPLVGYQGGIQPREEAKTQGFEFAKARENGYCRAQMIWFSGEMAKCLEPSRFFSFALSMAGANVIILQFLQKTTCFIRAGHILLLILQSD